MKVRDLMIMLKKLPPDFVVRLEDDNSPADRLNLIPVKNMYTVGGPDNGILVLSTRKQ